MLKKATLVNAKYVRQGIIHIDTPLTVSASSVSGSLESSIGYLLSSLACSQVFLFTIQVKVFDSNGNPHTCRGLFGSGSRCNGITFEIAKILGLLKQSIDMTYRYTKSVKRIVKGT